MKVLIVKTSSMGDVLHTLPAITDAKKNVSNIEIDWLVEPSFSEIPRMHSGIKNVIEIPIRKWKKNLIKYCLNGEIIKTIRKLRLNKYDKIIDAQGLLKSALVTKLMRGKSYGLNWSCAREPISSLFYDNKINVSKNQHAVTRTRKLFARSLFYEINVDVIDYGIDINKIINKDDDVIKEKNLARPFVIFFHGTTWKTKHWPNSYWFELAKIFASKGINIYVTSYNKEQKLLVNEMSKQCDKVFVLPTLNIFQVSKLIINSVGVIGVDTGFCHLSAALNKPTVALYGPTSHIKTGTMGQNQIHLFSSFSCSPCFLKNCKIKQDTNKNDIAITPLCFKEITPLKVWNVFQENFL